MVYRFQVVDNLGGIESGDYLSPDPPKPRVLRFASNIRLRVSLSADEKIYIPYLDITYLERVVSEGALLDDTATVLYKVTND